MMRRLWTMLAHFHGQLWNGSELARSLGEAHTTVKRHLDVLVISGGKRYGVEIQYADAPRPTKSMRIAVGDLGLARLFVVYPGSASFLLADKIEAVSLIEARKRLAALRR